MSLGVNAKSLEIFIHYTTPLHDYSTQKTLPGENLNFSSSMCLTTKEKLLLFFCYYAHSLPFFWHSHSIQTRPLFLPSITIGTSIAYM